MFQGATSFNQYLGWTPDENANFTNMFKDAELMQSTLGVGDTPSIYYFNPYIFTDKNTLQTAIDAWIDDQDSARETYGDINKWDVSQITDFTELFKFAVPPSTLPIKHLPRNGS